MPTSALGRRRPTRWHRGHEQRKRYGSSPVTNAQNCCAVHSAVDAPSHSSARAGRVLMSSTTKTYTNRNPAVTVTKKSPRERVPHPASDSHAPSQRSVSGGAEESADAHAAVTSTARIGEACRCLRTSVSGWTPLRSCRHSMNRARTTSVSRGGVVKTARLDPTLGVERQLLREGRDSRRPGACVM
jgi:hypothetical protein